MAIGQPQRAGTRVLVWLMLATVPGFGVTAFVSREYHAEERSLAREWRGRGAQALSRGDPVSAADAFRTALTFDRDDFGLRLDLARALQAGDRRIEARARLLALRDEQPGNADVNLELGRLAAEDRDSTSAIRYYHDAIEGAWARHPEEARRAARLELAEFLVGAGLTVPAQAELITLAGDLPEDPAFKERVGVLLTAAGLPSRALPLLRSVVSSRPSAAAAAGRAAFELGEDALAERYLTAARDRGEADAALPDMLQILELSRAADPLLPRLPARDRISRSIRVLDAARARLETCERVPPDAAAVLESEIAALRGELARARVADPDQLQRTLQSVLRAETAADACGTGTALDRALARMAARREGAGR